MNNIGGTVVVPVLETDLFLTLSEERKKSI